MKTGLKVLVTILIVAVIGLGGFIVYDKIIKGDPKDIKTVELQEEIDKLKADMKRNENQVIREEKDGTSASSANYINGAYSGTSGDSINYVFLFGDGKFIDMYINSHIKGGTYSISGEKITLNYNANPAAGNDNPETVVANISSDHKTITFSNGYSVLSLYE